MVVGLLAIEFYLPGARSLKDKRTVLRTVKDRVRARFNVAIAEVEHQDLWQRAGLGVVAIGTDRAQVDRDLAAVADAIEQWEPGLVARTGIEFLT
jgi:hypothetical protein